MGRRPKGRKSVDALAEEYGINWETLRQYALAGVDIYDPESVFNHRRMQQDDGKGNRTAAAMTDDPQELSADLTYDAQRTFKLWQENRLLSLKYDVECGKYVPATKVREDLIRIGSALKAGLMRMEAELPPTLVGMSPGAMAKTIREHNDELLTRFSDQTDELYKP